MTGVKQPAAWYTLIVEAADGSTQDLGPWLNPKTSMEEMERLATQADKPKSMSMFRTHMVAHWQPSKLIENVTAAEVEALKAPPTIVEP